MIQNIISCDLIFGAKQVKRIVGNYTKSYNHRKISLQNGKIIVKLENWHPLSPEFGEWIPKLKLAQHLNIDFIIKLA